MSEKLLQWRVNTRDGPPSPVARFSELLVRPVRSTYSTVSASLLGDPLHSTTPQISCIIFYFLKCILDLILAGKETHRDVEAFPTKAPLRAH